MRVTCVIHSLNGGGAERVMAGLASRLQAKGHQITLLTIDDGKADKHEVSAAVHRVALDVMRVSQGKFDAIRNNLQRIKKLRTAIAESNPEVVLSFCDATNVLVLLATWRLTVPVVVSERSDPAKQSLVWPWSWLRPQLYKRAAEVIVLTQSAADTVRPWCRSAPTIIASAVNKPPAMDRSFLSSRTDKVLLGVGRLEKEKGFDRLVTSFTQIADRFPHWHLKIIGEGSCLAALMEQANASGLTDRIHLPGWQRPIWPAYQDADLFALTSHYEGFPSALLEAMAVGVASIAVDCESGPRQIIRDQIDGLLIANDQQAITHALERCMSNETLRTRLSEEATSVIDRFGWDAMTDAYEQRLIQSIAFLP
jgi:GalNAc-alpha-(1->4)-GalNAc-alpha-(1->3)-diNAcBac-PP-undecaprenol alpha-1,4-N-acetyl-D-galactosaminyltransferase